MPGAFKLDHLQPIKPLFFPYFSNFSTFILRSHFLLPQGANYGTRISFFDLLKAKRGQKSQDSNEYLSHAGQSEPLLAAVQTASHRRWCGLRLTLLLPSSTPASGFARARTTYMNVVSKKDILGGGFSYNIFIVRSA